MIQQSIAFFSLVKPPPQFAHSPTNRTQPPPPTPPTRRTPPHPHPVVQLLVRLLPAFLLNTSIRHPMRYLLSILLLGSPLLSQGLQGIGLNRSSEGIQYQFQLRASKAGSAFRDLAGDQVSGGGGFMAVIGDTPLRLRLRVDGDFYPSQNLRPKVNTQGLGVEAFLLLPASDTVTPYLSLGPTFQHWEFGGGDYLGQAPQSSNKLGARIEAGAWFKRRFAVSAGLFYGTFVPGKTASNPYLAITLQF